MNTLRTSVGFLILPLALLSGSAFADSYCQGDNGQYSVSFQVYIAKGDLNAGDASGSVTARSDQDGRSMTARFEQGSVSYNVFGGTMTGSNDNGDSFTVKLGQGTSGEIEELNIGGQTITNVPVSCR